MPRNQTATAKYASPRSPAPMPAAQRPGFFSNVWQGFGFGAGQSIAASMFGPSRPAASAAVAAAEPLLPLKPKEYVQCMKDNEGDKDLCEQFLKNG